jgi:nucleotide-binding universal stress UspA family protein
VPVVGTVRMGDAMSQPSFHEILVHVAPSASRQSDAGFEQALALAGAHNARLSAMIYEAEVSSPVTWSGVEVPLPASLPPTDTKPIENAAAALAEKAAHAGVTFEAITDRSYAFGVGESFADVARVRDVSVLTIPTIREIGRRFIVEAALFQSGRPVILVPRRAEPVAFQRVLVAWDASRASVRALNDAMPILARARSVTIASVNDDKSFRPGQSAVELTRHLAHAGVTATFKDVKRQRRNVAAALVDTAHDEGASLIVMGAYAHSRLRDLILGSTTREMLKGASDIPVLMST